MKQRVCVSCQMLLVQNGGCASCTADMRLQASEPEQQSGQLEGIQSTEQPSGARSLSDSETEEKEMISGDGHGGGAGG